MADEHLPEPRTTWRPGLWWFLFWAIVFTLAYTRAPLHFSNQNQYLLHGMAKANVGQLSADWLANTADPTPIYSAMVKAVYLNSRPEMLFVFDGLLLGIYFCSLLSIMAKVAQGRWTATVRWWLAALLVIVQSGMARYLSFQVFNVDYACYFQGWLAAQYLLGPVFQPSLFGVLLIASIALFLNGSPRGAVTVAALGATIHTTYLLSAAMLTIAYMSVYLWRKEYWRAAGLGMLSLFYVLPIVIYSALTFQATSPEQFAESQRILAQVRIPHHAVAGRWVDAITWVQVGGIALGVLLSWRTKLFPVMVTLSVCSALLTVLQIATKSDFLALVFPWRTSTLLIPLALGVILTRCLWVFPRGFNRPWLATLAGVVAVGVAAFGVWMMINQKAYLPNDRELAFFKIVRERQQPGRLYLIPTSIPDQTKFVPGSVSNDFRPPRAPTGDKATIPVDFQRFRLDTQSPIYVDFKAIPYKDTDVLEWYARVQWNQEVYRRRDWDQDNRWPELRQRGITHVVTTIDKPITSQGLKIEFQDDRYIIYEVLRAVK